MRFAIRRHDRRLAAYQLELLRSGYAEIEDMYQQMRTWRHNYRSHIQTMKAHVAAGELDALSKYLDELDQELKSINSPIRTGNPMTDAILSSKLSLARAKGIPCVVDADIPLRLSISELDLCCILGNLFDNAMEASLASIVDEGEQPDSFLSGGVDSSYILAKSQAKTGYCVAYEDQAASEEEDARATASYLGRDFEGIVVSPQDFFRDVDEFLLAYEQPSGDVAGLALYSACKKVAEKSSLCFSGEGADEFFAGYSVYENRNRLRFGPDPAYFGTTYIMNDDEQRRYLKEFYPERSARAFMKERGAKGLEYDALGWMLYVDLRSYFEGSILFNSTKIARGTGLDIRMPYCDLRLFDIARRMPSRFKASKDGNKIALRAAAARVLPLEVAYRRKLGFPVPVRKWLADPAVNADIRRAFESPAAAEFFNVDEIGALLDAFLGREPRVKHPVWFARHKALLWRHVWTIYIFIRWYELFFEGE